MVKEKVIVMGLGLSTDDLTPAHMEVIRSADLLLGGQRHLARFDYLPMEKHVIAGDIGEVMDLLRARAPHHRIVVLASGDPLIFGIGGRIVRELGARQVCIVPNISSVATAFARIGQPWEEAGVVSLHGRDDTGPLAEALKAKALVAVHTDRRHSPAWLAGWLLEKGAGHARLAVFERLGQPEEKFGWYAPDQAAAGVFSEPNLVVIKWDAPASDAASRLHLGLEEAAFAHEKGLITKAEVRAVVLAKLALTPGLTLWDLGAGSGAVGIEASLLLGVGRIMSVEKRPERARRIKENARRWGVYNLEVIQATLPEGLDRLPRPDRIFIGGGGRVLPAIIGSAAERLARGGIMVVNTILLDNLAPAIAVMEARGLSVEVIQIQVSRSRSMPWSRRLAGENPVWILSGRHDWKKKGKALKNED